MKKLFSFSNKIIRYLPHIPVVFMIFQNPITFLKGYFTDSELLLKMRNGIVFKTQNRDDVSSISAIVIKKEYGKFFKSDNHEKIIVDIGANKGYFSLFAAMNRRNKLFAYEPIPATYEQLVANVAKNQINTIKTFNFGVAGARTNRNFSFTTDTSIISSMVFTAGGQTVTIQCVTLGDIFTENNLNRIDILKIDCEGAEFEIFYNTPLTTLAKIKNIRMGYHNDSNVSTSNIDHLSTYLGKAGFKRTHFRQDGSALGIAWFENNTNLSA